MYELFVN